MLGCYCLNVIIESEEDDFQKITFELSEEESVDEFFKQEIQQVGKLININKSHAGLIQTRNVGSWVVHYCINCDVHSHAVHRDKGASCVLVNSHLLTDEAIDKLRRSENYSKLYKIVIKADEITEDDPVANSYLPNDVENVIKGFKQVAADALKNESLAVEERIRHFSDEQYRKLDELRERTFREQQTLIKIILNNSVDNNTKQPTSTNLLGSMSSNNQQTMPTRLNEPLAAGSVNLATSPKTPTRHTPKRQKSCPLNQVNSLDTEGLFEFDGMDEGQSGGGSEVEESDIDESTREEGGGVKIPKNAKTTNSSIAKSLPMTIPAFLSQTRNNKNFEDIDDIGPPIEPTMDIAASIKALAKSVHGDPVFGDLPKPRYTYI